jgi:hypothetical protein
VEYCFQQTHDIAYTTFNSPQWRYHAAIVTQS